MPQGEHSAVLSTFIKLPFFIKTFVLSIFKWPLKTSFTVLFNTYFYIQLPLQKYNMWGILGSLEVTSLVPGSCRLSGSMILQTTALAILLWIVLKVVQYVRYRRWLEKEFGDAPGPKEKHWLFGSLANVSYSQPFAAAHVDKQIHIFATCCPASQE